VAGSFGSREEAIDAGYDRFGFAATSFLVQQPD